MDPDSSNQAEIQSIEELAVTLKECVEVAAKKAPPEICRQFLGAIEDCRAGLIEGRSAAADGGGGKGDRFHG